MKCKVCGKKAESEFCFAHKPRKPLRSKPYTKKEDSEKLKDFFMSIWTKRLHSSEVSHTYLGQEAFSVFFHHILLKEKYPQACFDEENIILLTLDEHTSVHTDMYKYEEINKRREYLKIKYNID